jgi:uncharacterized OB-fold protein
VAEAERAAFGRPAPLPSPQDEAFWAGCREHKLLLPKCQACGAFRFWDFAGCPQCGSAEAGVVQSSGRGTVWSYSVVHHAFNPAWKDEVPYTVVVVALEEGPRFYSNLVKGEPEPRIGQSVEVVFHDLPEGESVPLFRSRSA